MNTHSPLPKLTAKELSEAEELLAGGRHKALSKARYFASVIYKIVPRAVDATPAMFTASVTERGIMLWCPHFLLGKLPSDWFEDSKAPPRLTPENVGALWLHESLHLINAHASRRGSRQPQIYNMAGDLAINPSVREIGLPLPGKGLWPADFGWPENETADEYYARLEKLAQQGPCANGAEGDGGTLKSGKSRGKGASGKDGKDGHGSGGQKAPQPGQGWCGSCAGHAVPNEPGDGDAEGRTETEIERAAREFAEAVRAETQRGRGSVPLGVLRAADELLKPPKIPWQKKLGALTRRAVAWAAGAVDHRYDAPSRRQAALGFGAGVPVLGRLRAPVPRVAVAIDTSGSMGDEELSRAVAETVGVAKAVGAHVDMYSCDAAVHAAAPVKSFADVKRNLRGGGGTYFQPVLDALARARNKPDVLIYITDGGNFDTPKAPRGMRVVWVLVGKHRCRPHGVDFGEFVEVDED